MNLTWHIIKKDLRCIVWPLVFWLASGIYVATHPVWSIRNISDSTFTYLPLVATMVHGIMFLAVIAAVVQADDSTAPTSFWRARPISPARLVGAKLLLLGTLFVGIQPLLSPGIWLNFPWLYRGFEPLVWAALSSSLGVVAIAALAACVKDVGQFFLLSVGCFVMCAAIGTGLEAISIKEAGLRAQSSDVFQFSMIVTGLIVGAAAIAILYNQYFLRRRGLSWTLIAVGCGAAVTVNRLAFLIFA